MVVSTVSTPLELSDEQLLARFAQGERVALEELFQRHRMLAYRIAYRLLGREADALDAVQEGFINALTHLDGFQGRSSFKTWLLRVVSNAALDMGRRKRYRREAVSLDALESGEEESSQFLLSSNPTLEMEQEELRGLLARALALLPEAQRRTFVLHVDGELNYREVAEALGISIGTVMSRLFYTRRKLRAYLTQWTESYDAAQ